MSFKRCEVEFMVKLEEGGKSWGGLMAGLMDGGGWIGKDRKGQEEREIGKGSDKGNE